MLDIDRTRVLINPPDCPFHIGQRVFNQGGNYMGPVKSIFYEPSEQIFRAYIVEDPSAGGGWWAAGSELRCGISSIGRHPGNRSKNVTNNSHLGTPDNPWTADQHDGSFVC